MTKRDAVIAVLRAHEPELRDAGVEALSVFDSVARGDAGEMATCSGTNATMSSPKSPVGPCNVIAVH